MEPTCSCAQLCRCRLVDGYGHIGSQEASDITLLDDSFSSSIATAVMWGRSLYQNIQRFILFQLTINVTALLIVFLGSYLWARATANGYANVMGEPDVDTFAAGALASLPPNPKEWWIVNHVKVRISYNTLYRYTYYRYGILLFVVLLLGMMFYFADSAHLNETFGYIDAEDETLFPIVFLHGICVATVWNLFNAQSVCHWRIGLSASEQKPWLLGGIITYHSLGNSDKWLSVAEVVALCHY